MNYKLHMIEVCKTKEFRNWLTNLRDQRAIMQITIRIARVEAGLMGDVKPICHAECTDRAFGLYKCGFCDTGTATFSMNMAE